MFNKPGTGQEKGTIRLLEEWLAAQYKPADRQPIDEMFMTLKMIRKMRQHPAHAVDENVFDQTYIEQQRQLVIAAYEAVNTLRQVFSHHPQARSYQVPSWLDEGKIYTY